MKIRLLDRRVPDSQIPECSATVCRFVAYCQPTPSVVSRLRTRRSRLAAKCVARAIALAAVCVLAGGASAMAAGGGALPWVPFTSEAYTKAEHSGQPFVVTFGAEWCAPCKEMEQRTYTDPAVVEAAKGIHFLQVDMTGNDSYAEVVRKSFKVFGAPTTVFFGPDRKERTRRIGFIGPEDYVKLLRETRAPASASN
ncbi:MAG TPA: thioredoxin family protein [Candidatus Limnocylindrales bacterium]|nr:thioredoxin family protein [Candidatus Limnocylindrales bacterium]